MPPARRPAMDRWWKALLAAATGAGLALAAGTGGAIAAVCATLAQPAFALAAALWRGRDASRLHDLGRDTLALALLWVATAVLIGVLLAWPLSSLLQSGALGPVLALSLVAGLALLGLWRLWPLWHGVEREGGSLATHWLGLAGFEYGAWRGLLVAGIVALLAVAPLLLAWPGLLDAMRWPVAGALALLSAPLHILLQRTAPADALPESIFGLGDGIAYDSSTTTSDVASAPSLAQGESLEAALYAAARGGRVERALVLLEAGADPHAPPAEDPRDQRSLPVLAAVLPDLRLLRALIGTGLDVNTPHAGMTPLLAATRDSWHGRPEAVMTLLANGADPRLCDVDGNTPLHHAARSSDPGVVALLLDAAAELETPNHDGLTPLGVACAVGNWRLARFLLERGAKPQSEDTTPALLAAAGTEEDDAAGVQLLLKHKARIDARDAAGRSALHEAAQAGHVDVLTTLLSAHADVQARDAEGRTPLLDAACGAHLPVVEALIAAGADVAAVDQSGLGALQLACLADTPSPALARRLLELGADSQLQDAHGRRAIEHAAHAGRWSLVAVLDPSYPLPSTVVADIDSDTDAGPVSDRTPRELLREGLDEGRFEQLDNLTKLVSPAQLGHLLLDGNQAPSHQRITWLLARGADPEARHGFDDSPVFALLARGPAAVSALQLLLRHGASPAGVGGLARFLDACVTEDQGARGLEDCTLDLLSRGADPYAPSPAGDPPLALAVRLGWQRLLERLLDHGVDLDARDSRGMSALHLAAALGREAALKRLVMHGASPQVRAADGQTPLGVALSAGRRDLADWLDWHGWPLPGRPLREEDLPAAAIVGDADAVRRLLDLGFAVDTMDSQGCTGLLRAAGGGHSACVELLLSRGADPQLAAHTGATPLSASVSMRHGEIVDRLLQAGAGLEQRLPGDVTVLMLAAALGLPDLCARLLQAGANVHAGDAQGLTPLHCAALFGFTSRDKPRLVALFDILLLAGAEPDAEAAGNVTPLLLLLGARAEPGTACDEEVVLAGLERLLDEDVALDARDPRGFGPLHLAALHGLLRITHDLLRAGCDPDQRDALNRSPREIAVMRGFVDVAGEYAPAIPGGVSMARFLRDPG